jgi:hypothetical protein
VSAERLQVLHEDREVLVCRLNGIPRDPDNGQHRRLIVYCSPTLGLRETARRLRTAADQLEDKA